MRRPLDVKAQVLLFLSVSLFPIRKRPVEAVSTECQRVETMTFVDTSRVSTKVRRGHFRTSEG